MSRPDGVTGCESDEIGQKMCLGDAVGASDLQMLDAPFFLEEHTRFCADAQYLAHLVDVQYIRVIPEHHTVRITGIQIFLTQTDSPLSWFIFSRSNARLHFRAFSICAISHSLVIPIKLLMRSLSMVKICSSSTTDGRLNAGVLLNENMGGLVWLFGDF